MNASREHRGRAGATRFKPFAWRRVLLAAIALAGARAAQAQFVTPLHVGAAGAISNEFGQVLPGNAASPGSAVLLLWASNSVIHPPDTSGAPHPNNPPVEHGLTRIGHLTSPALDNPGLFGLSIAEPRPGDGAKVFVRVFNRNSVMASSFYADSQLLTVSGNKELIAQVGATTNALDTADHDGDGLHNSWEKSYGTDPDKTDTDGDGIDDPTEIAMGSAPTLADSDGDGMIDGHEWRAGTRLDDPASYLGLAGITPAVPHLVVRWASVTGRSYQVESAPGNWGGAPGFAGASDVIPASTGALTETTITNALDAEPHVYRIRLVEE